MKPHDQRPGLPWGLLLFDVLGAVFLGLGVLAETGIDFGHPVLERVAPVLIVVGALLMAPLFVWAVRRAQRRRPR